MNYLFYFIISIHTGNLDKGRGKGRVAIVAIIVGNEVCPNTEHEIINSGTTGTGNTHTEASDTTDDVDQA